MIPLTVAQLIDRLNLGVFHLADPDAAVLGGYCGDLLSWVMGRAGEGEAWLTIMSNINVAAVASLAGAPCVILTEGVPPDPPLLARAREQGVTLLGTGLSTYRCAAALSNALSQPPEGRI